MKQGKIVVPGQLWNYALVEGEFEHPDIGSYTSYGLQVPTPQGVVVLHDISPDRGFVEQLLGLFNSQQLEPIHLQEVVENFLAYPERLEAASASGIE